MLVKFHELATLIWSHSKLATSATPTAAAQHQHLPSPGATCMQAERSGPTQQLQLAQGDQAGGQRGLHPCQDACPSHGGSMFRGTGVDGAPLTHSPVRDPVKWGCWRALSCKANEHMGISTSSSQGLLFTQPPQGNTHRFI